MASIILGTSVETGELHPFRTVKIAGDRVVAVGAASELLPEAEDRVIEARGAVLVPGLAEMHGHLPRDAQGREFAEDVLFLYLSHGITAVRGMLGDAQQLELREAVRSGQLDGPRLIVGSPPMTGGSTATPEEAREQVAAYAAAGYEHLKVHEALSPEVYDAICESAREAHLRVRAEITSQFQVPVGASDCVAVPFGSYT